MAERVLFFDFFTAWSIHSQLNAILAKALSVRGAQVCAARCRGILRMDVPGGVSTSCGLLYSCEQCIEAGDRFYNNLNIPQVFIDDYIAPADLTTFQSWVATTGDTPLFDVHYQSVPLGHWAISPVLTIFRIGPDDVDHPQPREQAQSGLFAAFLGYIAGGRIIESWEPTKVVLFNGRFSPYRAAYEVSREHGLPVVVHERAWYGGRGYLFYENDHPPHMGLFHRLLKAWRNVALSESEIEFSDDILMHRRYGKKYGSVFNYYDNPNGQPAEVGIRRTLGIPEDATVIGCFTSSSDEAWTVEEASASILQRPFMENLFEVMRGRPEWLVVRHHPNIGGRANALSEGSALRAYFDMAARAPDNVRVIMPHEDVTSYDLIPHLDAAFALFTNFGLELGAHGVPSIGFKDSTICALPTVTMNGLEPGDIAQAIDRVLTLDRRALENDVISAYRFFYHAIAKHCYVFKSFWIENDWQCGLAISGIEDFLPGADPVLDHVCGYFLDGAPLHMYPSIEDRAKPDTVERAFAAGRMDDHAALRGSVAVEPSGQLPLVAVFSVGVHAEGYRGNWHPALAYKAVLGVGLDARMVALLNADGCDFVAITHPSAHHDLTMFHSTAQKIAQSPGHRIGFVAAWRRLNSTLILMRRTPSVEDVLELRRALGDDLFVQDILPRVVWRIDAFRDFQAAAAANGLADAVQAMLTGDEVLYIDKTRLLIG